MAQRLSSQLTSHWATQRYTLLILEHLDFTDGLRSRWATQRNYTLLVLEHWIEPQSLLKIYLSRSYKHWLLLLSHKATAVILPASKLALYSVFALHWMFNSPLWNYGTMWTKIDTSWCVWAGNFTSYPLNCRKKVSLTHWHLNRP